MLHDAESGHGQAFFKLGQRLTILLEQLVEQTPAVGSARALKTLSIAEDYM